MVHRKEYKGLAKSAKTALRIKLLLILLCFITITSCKKEPDPEKQAKVTYEVIETSAATPSFTVSYTAEGNATKTEGPISTSTWKSAMVTDKQRGDFVSFTLDSNSGSGTFKMRIYMNGVLWMEETADIPFTPKTISGNLPQ